MQEYLVTTDSSDASIKIYSFDKFITLLTSFVSTEFVIQFPQNSFLRFEVPKDKTESLKSLIKKRCAALKSPNDPLMIFTAPSEKLKLYTEENPKHGGLNLPNIKFNEEFRVKKAKLEGNMFS